MKKIKSAVEANTQTETPETFTQVVRDVLASLDIIEKRLAPRAIVMTPEQKRRSARPRKGAAHVINQVAGLAQHHGLDSKLLDSHVMLENQNVADQLTQVAQVITRVLTMVTDTQFAAGSAAWQVALQFYSLLQRQSVNDGQLSINIAPIEHFFSYRHEKILETKPTKLQTRAKAKLAEAERLMSRARDRVGAVDATPAPVVSTPIASAPVTQPAPQPVAIPVATPAAAPASTPMTQSYVMPKTNGAANGALNGSYNGAASAPTNGGG